MIWLRRTFFCLAAAMWFAPTIPHVVSPSAAHTMHGVAIVSIALLIAANDVLADSLRNLFRDLTRQRKT
ncbi:hypothetical protein [Phenylobacterium aquaticum]|uniref:hypothetical protein n=1 Tax=Phenylobacterium aquaticum TaxID=1763816 RepID=UPI001F5D611D|nr:hypothetical protein [Phenylobacterium aquaticum]MCI3134019.1 hypothetical protein [Phenylobacterium aquaticum]